MRRPPEQKRGFISELFFSPTFNIVGFILGNLGFYIYGLLMVLSNKYFSDTETARLLRIHLEYMFYSVFWLCFILYHNLNDKNKELENDIRDLRDQVKELSSASYDYAKILEEEDRIIKARLSKIMTALDIKPTAPAKKKDT